MKNVEYATYTTRPALNDPHHGTFFYTSCCDNRMYSVRDKMSYDGVLCPKCNLKKRKKVILRFDGGWDWNDELEKDK